MGPFINNLTVSGGGGHGFCDNSTKASVIISVTMRERGQKMFKIASFIDDPQPNLIFQKYML
jgi:hypothetical protein